MENVSNIILAYQNEINSPEILPYKDLTGFIKDQKEKIKLSNGVIKTIYEQDFERVNYFVTQYLKARLGKINRNTDRTYLSAHEKTFIDDYEMKNETMKGCYVCIYCINNVSAVMDNNVIEMKEGDCYVGLWDELRNLIIDGDAILF